MCVCALGCAYVCVYCMRVHIVCVYACMYICMCVYVHVYVCTCVCISVYTHVCEETHPVQDLCRPEANTGIFHYFSIILLCDRGSFGTWSSPLLVDGLASWPLGSACLRSPVLGFQPSAVVLGGDA